MRGASLAPPPPVLRKTRQSRTLTRHKTWSTGSKRGSASGCVLCWGEQGGKTLARIHSCQKVKAQLKPVRDNREGNGEKSTQELEDKLQSLVDQCKDARATEVAQAALEAAATVQAAQQTAGVGGGAAGDASLPAAAASSIRDRVDALMSPPLSPPLKVEDLRSLTQHARDLLQRGLVFAVHTTAGQSRQASLSLEDDRLYLHCLRDQPLPRGAVTLQVGQPLLSLALSLPSYGTETEM
ncbi:hypothetical protein GWK47_037256 [Chionoecetes opilio]|uniref:Uncharacterized protein n=1 Tax=Chionoecetes opilio TaxID=41210 RepID=A0A8J5CMP2_CHIOP|nr:hypothetical protein GWK47_037256 [Chionoecetes opilio]